MRNIQVWIFSRLFGKTPFEGEKRVSDPLQNIRRVNVEVGLVSSHRELVHPSPGWRLIGAPPGRLRKRICQESKSTSENELETTENTNQR